MKPTQKFNTTTKTKVTGKMSKNGANLFGCLIGISAVILSVALLIAAMRF